MTDFYSEPTLRVRGILWTPSLTPDDGDTILELAYAPNATEPDETPNCPSGFMVRDTHTWDEAWEGERRAKMLLFVGEDSWMPSTLARLHETEHRFDQLHVRGGSIISLACGGSWGDTGDSGSLWVGWNTGDPMTGGTTSALETELFMPHQVGAMEVVTKEFPGRFNGLWQRLANVLDKLDSPGVTTYTATSTGAVTDEVVILDASGGSFVWTPPDAAATAGRIITVIGVGGSSEVLSIVDLGDTVCAQIVSTGSNWRLLQRYDSD